MKKSSFLEEFKAFAMKGNVIDMAVGVIIGGAFGKIVSSLVADIVMPLVGILVGSVNFRDLTLKLSEAVLNAKGEVITPAVTIAYGLFLQNVLDFLLIAFSIFVAIKLLGKLKKKEEVASAPEAPQAPTPTNEEVLLTEIRDLLKEKK
ncbi:MAG: large-conductance mechanosensitive channel protein MscL [Bacteroidaceae bacterium]|nr:large-conductance mechanosensitive channel protein MscL [Bacteroidaceae bacterium]MBP9637329.1 large-conductance mechanosensitive channel protein MscL [Bacteroidaceae bacterium]